MSEPVYQGIVKWYKAELGFGFIAVAPSVKKEIGLQAEQDLFVHAGGVAMAYPKVLLPEQRVEFQVQPGSRGPRAIHCRPVRAQAGRRLASEEAA